jgi:hypothetical protein
MFFWSPQVGNHPREENAIVRSQKHLQMDLFAPRPVQRNISAEQQKKLLQLITEMLSEATKAPAPQQKDGAQAVEARNE